MRWPLKPYPVILAAVLIAGSLLQVSAPPAHAQGTPVTVSFLTHWPPETVAKLSQGTKKYAKDHPGVTIQIRAVPFADLLTTLRSQAGGSNAFTIASIYDLWLPELVRDGIVVEAPDAWAAEVKKGWPESAVAAASVGGKCTASLTRSIYMD